MSRGGPESGVDGAAARALRPTCLPRRPVLEPVRSADGEEARGLPRVPAEAPAQASLPDLPHRPGLPRRGDAAGRRRARGRRSARRVRARARRSRSARRRSSSHDAARACSAGRSTRRTTVTSCSPRRRSAASDSTRCACHVSSNPPHKRVDVDAETRLGLARLAFPNDDGRARRAPVLDRHACSGYGDDAIFLVGADQFAKFLTWRDARRDPRARAPRRGHAAGLSAREARRRARPQLRAAGPGRVLRHGADSDLVERHPHGSWRRALPIDGLVPPAVARGDRPAEGCTRPTLGVS